MQRILSSSVVSPHLTRPRVTAKTKPNPSISGTAYAFTDVCTQQCADTSVLFASTGAWDVHIKNVLDNVRRKVNQLHKGY